MSKLTNFRKNWIFFIFLILSWVGGAAREDPPTYLLRMYFILLRYHTFDFKQKIQVETTWGTSQTNVHFAFHSAANIWDFPKLVSKGIFCSKRAWMMSWYYEITSSTCKWVGPPLSLSLWIRKINEISKFFKLGFFEHFLWLQIRFTHSNSLSQVLVS